MDHQTFDRLTRLFGIAGSRRTAWRALIAGALLGATTRSAAASVRRSPLQTCKEGDGSCRGDECCGATCCPGRCFTKPETGQPYCCTQPEYVICGNPDAANPDEQQVCCPKGGSNPCSCAGGGLISGSYRRR